MGYGTEMNGCGRFMKYSLFFANFVIFIGGCIIAGLAIWAIVDKIPYASEIAGSNLLSGSVYVLLAGGIIVAIIAFFGCIGASREVKCMLLTYAIILFILFVSILIGGVLAYVFRGKIKGELREKMDASMNDYRLDTVHNQPHNDAAKTAWDTTQRSLGCCGINGYRDWSMKAFPKLPSSCCREIRPGEYHNCEYNPIPSTTYTQGCLTKVQDNIEKHSAIIGAAGIAVACLMLFGLIFSLALFRKIK